MNTGAFEDYKMLLSKLEHIKSDCTALASGLSALAEDLHGGRLGRLKDIADRILFLEKNFNTCKKEVMALPGAASEPFDADKLTSLADMETLLQSFHIQMQQAALQILDEVQAIVHKDNKDFQPLQSCHAKATALQQAILEIDLPGLHPDVPALLNGIHPFNELLLLVRRHRNLDEERIEELEDRMQNSFGRLLFLAIVRDKLDFSSRPVVPPAQAPSPSKKEQIVKKKTDEPQNIKEFSLPAQKKTGAVEDRVIDKHPEFPRAETIFQQQPSPDRSESASRPMLKKDKAEENKNNILKDLSQTKVKLERALKYGFIQKSEYERLAAIIQDIEASLPEKIDFMEDEKSLLSVRTALDEQEESAVEGRRLAMRQEFQQIRNS
ncbi:MAG: hypothetical protein CVU74_05805 [Deltaproteobacteria bacterium HGW-Deltaproteobacteria-9]|nr:MAG: hypothetical protein CVU74_05805 [Deltaproteobacteria bacterium HGW-Deltaproteobacteria-9]